VPEAIPIERFVTTSERAAPPPAWGRADRRALGIALGVAGAALTSALSFTAPHQPIIPALLYLIPIALATAVGGRTAGAVGLAGSALGLEYLFLPPVRSWHVGQLTTVGTSRVSGWVVLAIFVAVGAITIELFARERDARRRAGAAEARLALLSEASAVLSRSFDYEKTLAEVAQIVAASFGGMCLVRLRGEPGRAERLVTAHPDAERDAHLGGLQPPLHLGEAMDALASGRGRATIVHAGDAFLRAIAGTESNVEILREGGEPTWIVAPMIGRDALLGAFAVAPGLSMGIADADADVVADLADRTAMAVDAALLFAGEERAREDAVAAAGRTARIQAVTAALSASVSSEQVGAIIARETRDALGADRSAVVELSPETGVASLLAAEGYAGAQLEALAEIDVTAGTAFPPDSATIATPLLLKGRLAGHLLVGFDDRRALGADDVDMLHAMAAICAQVLDRARLVEREQSARVAAEQSALRLALVSRASELLAVDLDYPRAYARLAELLVEQMADLCVIDVLDGDAIRRVAAAHVVPSRQGMVDVLRDRYAPAKDGGHPVARVLRTGQPEMSSNLTERFLRESAQDEEHLRIIRTLGYRSFMCVPLAARGRILGTITLVSTTPRRRYGEADLAVAQEVARRAAVGIDNALLYAAEQDARRAAEAAGSLSAALSDAASLDEVLDVVTAGMREALGAVNSTVALLDARGEELTVIRRLGDFSPRAEEWMHFKVNADLPLSEAVRTAAPVVLSSIEELTQRYRLLADLSSVVDHSLICLPLQVEGRAIGGIALGYPDVRSISPDDERLAMTLAGQAAQAVARARLFDAELDARRQAEGARERLSFLAEASRVLSASLDWNLTLGRVARLAVPAIADWCAVDVLDESGRIRRLAVAHADPRKAAAARRMETLYPPDPEVATIATRVIRSGTAELIRNVSESELPESGHDALRGVLAELGLHSIMVVPLPARGAILGAISFALSVSDRRFGPEDLELAEDLARRAGVAVDNARLYQERDRVAHTLQQSLLPKRLPAVPGLEFEGRYHALGSGNEVGGDFYDVFASGGGTWGMTIGDVCGKGPEAAAVMGVVRTTLRAAAMHEDRPSNLLRSLNEALRQHLVDERFCTVAYVRIRPGDRRARLTICLAGHPAAAVVRADGRVERAGRPGTLLGVLPDLSLTDVTVDLEEGDAIVLFTDGVTDERRGSGGEAGMMRALHDLRGASAADIANTLDRLIAGPRSQPPRDDAAILVARVISVSATGLDAG
jgi:GAF domain-containing protein